jgi:hypothetical protein
MSKPKTNRDRVSAALDAALVLSSSFPVWAKAFEAIKALNQQEAAIVAREYLTRVGLEPDLSDFPKEHGGLKGSLADAIETFCNCELNPACQYWFTLEPLWIAAGDTCRMARLSASEKRKRQLPLIAHAITRPGK